ncbi:MAG: hypothetical protein QOE34_829, partial [Verrucomicrobiota bacterium]
LNRPAEHEHADNKNGQTEQHFVEGEGAASAFISRHNL